ncbi:MAG TPA: hypothetical protein VM198_06475 [Longimicrobiales bacterium]|nr:hypothetical protein [Longimicrobiales bacterium]
MALGGPREGRHEPNMWQQFQRRRVIRTVLLYLALMFLVIEAYLLATQLVAFPPWGFRAVVGAAVLGFPFAVVLAWTYDLTPSGIVKTPEEPGPEPAAPTGPRRAWLITVVAALVAALVVRVLRT